MRRRAASALVILLWAALLLGPLRAVAQVPDDIRTSLTGRGYALLIGVARYDRNAWSELSSIASDLEDLRRELAPHFADVAVLRDPTTDEIRTHLRWFLRERGSDARLLIYYAGHGFTAFNPSSRQVMGYITGRDTPRCEETNCYSALANAIPFSEIDGLNRDTWARHVLMLFDSCFSGSVFLARTDDLEVRQYTYDRARLALREPVRYYITAGAANERVPANSPFAPLIVEGLRGAADVHRDGFVTAEALGVYLQRKLPAMARVTLSPQKGSIADARLSAGQFLFLTGLVRVPPPSLLMSKAEAVRLGQEAQRRGDEREAARLYRLAADQGDAWAQATLGAFYGNGWGGLAKDEREALRLYRLAADRGDAWAQARIGMFYEQGRGGLAKDEAQATRLYQQAARSGITFAQDQLRRRGQTW